MSKTRTLKTIRNFTPDKVFFSPGGRLKIALLQLVARLLPGGFAVWVSLLDDKQLERQVRVKFALRPLIPGNSAYDIPRLHLIIERRDWLAIQADSLRATEQSAHESPSQQEQPKPGLSPKLIFDLLGRLNRELEDISGRIRVNNLEPGHTRTLTLVINDSSLTPTGSFFDVDVPRQVLDRILSGELDPSSALLRGHISVRGDTGLAARLMNALNPPPAHPLSLPTPNTLVGPSEPESVPAINQMT